MRVTEKLAFPASGADPQTAVEGLRELAESIDLAASRARELGAINLVVHFTQESWGTLSAKLEGWL